MITPLEIRQKVARAYPRVLSAWMKGELDGFFPWTLRVNLKLKGSIEEVRASLDLLRAQAKDKRGWGYTVHWKSERKREYGRNDVPDRITIDTLDDFLRLANKRREFAVTCKTTSRIRKAFPALAEWVAKNVQTIGQHEASLDGLIEVARFFVAHPWPDCYARQIPAAVDTKFIERHQTVLKAWLNELLPATAIQSDEAKFERRFGLRDGQPHIAVRVLDPDLQKELSFPFDEFSVPLRTLAAFSIRDATVFIMENRTTLLTLPPFPRGIAIYGEGDAVTRLGKLEWLCQNRVVYWGDIDVEGFEILSSLRSRLSDEGVRSVMMDCETLRRHAAFIVKGNAPTGAELRHLTDDERATFLQCAEHRQRLEQEKIPQAYVEERIRELASISQAASI